MIPKSPTAACWLQQNQSNSCLTAAEVPKRLAVRVSGFRQLLIGYLTREELKELVRLLEKAQVVTDEDIDGPSPGNSRIELA
jgi:hypothetical protein